MPKTTFVVTLEVTIDDQGANVNEILEAVGRARDAMGVQLAQAVIEWEQDVVRDRLCGSDRHAKKGFGGHADKGKPGHRCRCRSFVKQGFRKDKRSLMTDLGQIAFRVGYVSCRRCGKRFAPALEALGLGSHQRHTGQLEREVVEATCRTSFRRSVEQIEGLCGIPVSKSSEHRWLAGLRIPEVNPPPLEMLLADGTGYKKAGRKRGELRLAIGVTSAGRIVPLGSWSGRSWRQIGREVKVRLAKVGKPSMAVVDGEQGLDVHFARLAERTQRSHWHLLRNLRVIMWQDKLKKAQTDGIGRRLAGILAVEIPEGDWEAIGPVTKEALRARVCEARERFQAMIDEFGALGYRKGKLYLEGARDRIFSRIDLWLETGIIAPRSTGVIEEIMREVGRRVKKLGWNWKDHGVTQQASMILLRRYSQDQWDAYWQERLDLQGRCRIRIRGFECLN
jgi:hypothetical protein